MNDKGQVGVSVYTHKTRSHVYVKAKARDSVIIYMLHK